MAKSPTGEGNIYALKIPNFKKTFPDDPQNPQPCKIEAYLDEESGGDRWSGVLGGKPPAPPKPKPRPHPPDPHPIPPHPQPRPDPPPAPPDLLAIVKEIAALVKDILVQLRAIQALLEKLAIEHPLACPLPLAGVGVALAAAIGSALGMAAAAAALTPPFTPAGIVGLIAAIVALIASLGGEALAMAALLQCLEQQASVDPKFAGELKAREAKISADGDRLKVLLGKLREAVPDPVL